MTIFGFAIEEVVEDLYRILLPQPSHIPLPFAMPVSVYVLKGSSPALINTGHPLKQDALEAALETIDLSLGNITKVVSTGRAPDLAGGTFCKEHYLLSAPEAGSTLLADHFSELRLKLRQDLDDLRKNPLFKDHSTTGDKALFEKYLPDSLTGHPVIPLAEGQEITLGDRTFTIFDAPGPTPGNMVLLEKGGGLLFSGDLCQYEPLLLESPSQLLNTLRKLDDPDLGYTKLLLPSHGHMDVYIQRAYRSEVLQINMMLNNITFMLPSEPISTPELVIRDLGYVPRDLVRFLGTCRRLTAFLQEIVRQEAMLCRGSGIWTQYALGFEVEA